MVLLIVLLEASSVQPVRHPGSPHTGVIRLSTRCTSIRHMMTLSRKPSGSWLYSIASVFMIVIIRFMGALTFSSLQQLLT